MSKYKNIEDLGEVTIIAKVLPADNWNKDLNQGKGGFEKGKQQTVTSKKTGQIGFKYNIESTIVNGEEKPLRYDNGEGKEYRYSILAWDEKSKEIADSGIMEIRIVPKLNADKEEVFVQDKETKEFVNELRFYINPAPKSPQVGVDDIGGAEDGSTKLYRAPKEVEEDDIPIINESDEIEDLDDSIPF